MIFSIGLFDLHSHVLDGVDTEAMGGTQRKGRSGGVTGKYPPKRLYVERMRRGSQVAMRSCASGVVIGGTLRRKFRGVSIRDDQPCGKGTGEEQRDSSIAFTVRRTSSRRLMALAKDTSNSSSSAAMRTLSVAAFTASSRSSSARRKSSLHSNICVHYRAGVSATVGLGLCVYCEMQGNIRHATGRGK